MTEILLGPTLTDGPTTKVKDKNTGKTYYKKQILREGVFDYTDKTGQKIKLDLSGSQLKNFVQSFSDGAYDEVPFQIGHSDDKDLKTRKGTVVKVDHIPGKGVDAYFELDQDAAAFVEKYPKFGVSPRLVMGIKRIDGKKYVGAIQHVAGTNVPRATGMSPWEKVELSEDGDTDSETPVVDLSTETIVIEREGKVVPPKQDETEGDVITLSADEYAFLQQQMKDYKEIMGDGGKKTETSTPTSPVDLSEVTGKADAALAQLAEMRAQAVKDSWAAKKSLLLSKGVPPAALNLAEPVMTSVDSQVFDLSDGEGGTVKVDSKTQMLGQLELMKGMVDLGGEKGHGISGVDEEDATPEEYRSWMDAQGI